MTDPRTILERELREVEVPPFTLEAFHARRDRKRRRDRVAAGLLGCAVTLLVAVFAVRALSGDTSRGPGTEPSPSVPPVETTRFESSLYGYALIHPATWKAESSDTTWTSGPLPTGNADVLLNGDKLYLETGSIPLPPGMTADEWLDRETTRAARLAGLDGSDFTVVPITVDGGPGRFSTDCGVMLAVKGHRGYVFRLFADPTTNTAFRAVIRSVELHPEDA